MVNVEILISGHSHIFAMGAPVGYLGPPALLRTPDDSGFFIMDQSVGDRSSAYWEKLIESSAERDVLIAYGGNQHHGSFLFAPKPLFDFFDECAPSLLDGATLVPRRLIEAFFSPSLNRLRLLVPQLFAAGCRAIRLVGTPPPKSDIHLFVDIIRETNFAKNLALKNGINRSDLEITPALLLLKLWRVIQELTAGVVSDDRVQFVPVPLEALDAPGFLAKQFYDYVPSHITHANGEFGRLMIQRAIQTLRT